MATRTKISNIPQKRLSQRAIKEIRFRGIKDFIRKARKKLEFKHEWLGEPWIEETYWNEKGEKVDCRGRVIKEEGKKLDNTCFDKALKKSMIEDYYNTRTGHFESKSYKQR